MSKGICQKESHTLIPADVTAYSVGSPTTVASTQDCKAFGGR